MTTPSSATVSPFHPGEIDAQRRAGVQDEAARLAHMLAPPHLDGRVAALLAERTFAVMTARDGAGRLWVSPLVGSPGYLQVASSSTLEVDAAPPSGDPLHGLPAGQSVGILVIDFATRRRIRINGTLTDEAPTRLTVEVAQAYGNCPQYIARRELAPEPAPAGREQASSSTQALAPEDVDQVRSATTFFLGTSHPDRGADASHKGGPPGFVRVDGETMWWPDFPGNNMFNSFGNLLVDDEAALLFPDFGSGRVLQLSGTAEIRWDDGDPFGAAAEARRAIFTVQERVVGPLLATRER